MKALSIHYLKLHEKVDSESTDYKFKPVSTQCKHTPWARIFPKEFQRMDEGCHAYVENEAPR